MLYFEYMYMHASMDVRNINEIGDTEFQRSRLYYDFKIVEVNKKMLVHGLGNGSSVKNVHCAFKTPKLESQPPYLAAYNS